MPFRKATLRKMPPVTRKYAKLLGELDSILRKGKNLVEEISRLELDSQALAQATGEKPLSQEEAERRFPHMFKDN